MTISTEAKEKIIHMIKTRHTKGYDPYYIAQALAKSGSIGLPCSITATDLVAIIIDLTRPPEDI